MNDPQKEEATEITEEQIKSLNELKALTSKEPQIGGVLVYDAEAFLNEYFGG